MCFYFSLYGKPETKKAKYDQYLTNKEKANNNSYGNYTYYRPTYPFFAFKKFFNAAPFHRFYSYNGGTVMRIFLSINQFV